MSELDLLKLLQQYGEETELADFTPDELQDMLDRMRDKGEEVPLTPEAFKEKYFAYYDDVKDKSLKKQDW
ncbi:MAG: hypothetical protein E7352_06475 [Clostridiales bacterium]|nr:hypothetical protein [Clostridiales bacterium]